MSKSPLRSNRAARGNFNPCASARPAFSGCSGSYGRELMAPLLAAGRQHFAATLRLHAYAKAVRLGPAAFARLICALWQSNPPSLPETFLLRCPVAFPNLARSPSSRWLFPRARTTSLTTTSSPAWAQNHPQTASAAVQESSSVFDPRVSGQEMPQENYAKLRFVFGGKAGVL